MSNNVFINPHPNSRNYSGLFPVLSPRRGIRCYQKLIIFYSKLFKEVIREGVVSDIKGGFDLDSFRLCTAVSLRHLSLIFLSLSLGTLIIK
jgi:hypothetical protein